MRSSKRTKVATFSFLVLIFPGALFAQTSPKETTGIFGEIKKGLYTNSVFGFQIQFPRDWHPLENEEAKALTKAGLQLMQLDEKVLEKNQKYRISLLSLMKKAPGEPENATVALSAMKQPSRSVDPLTIANLSRKGLAESPSIAFDTETTPITIAGKKFATFDYTIKAADRRPKGKYLVTMVRDYSITLFISTESRSDEKLVQGIIDSFIFH
jgi:hypothetical protein